MPPIEGFPYLARSLRQMWETADLSLRFAPLWLETCGFHHPLNRDLLSNARRNRYAGFFEDFGQRES